MAYKDYSGVYIIHNTTTNEIYVGGSKTVRSRLNHHKNRLLRNEHENKNLQDSFNVFGLNSFKFICIMECKYSDIFTEEKECEKIFIDNGYSLFNIDSCGKYIKRSDDTKKAISKGSFGKNTHISDEVVSDIKKKFNEGVKPKELSKLFNLPINLIYKYVREETRRNILPHTKYLK